MELDEALAAYRLSVSQAKDQIRQENKTRIMELTQEARRELSKVLHSLHASGTRKDVLRRLTGLYNTPMFDEVWNAYQPANPTDLRRRSTTTTTPSLPNHAYMDGGDAVFVINGTHQVRIDSPVYHEATDEDDAWVEFDVPDGYEDYYYDINKALLLMLQPEGEQS